MSAFEYDDTFRLYVDGVFVQLFIEKRFKIDRSTTAFDSHMLTHLGSKNC